MRAAEDPRSIVIRFSEDAGKPPELEVGLAITVGQLVQVSWELEKLAGDARQGQLMAQAQLQREAAAVAASIRNGGH